MAITAIRKLVDGKATNLIANTGIVEENGKEIVYVRMYLADDKLNPTSVDNKFEIGVTEEKFHTDLRQRAAIEKTLITTLCTNPEWTPMGYKKTLDNFLKDEKRKK